MEDLDDIIEKPISNFQINDYLPNVPVKLYKEFKHIKNLDEILPKNKRYYIFLYEESPNVGHWCGLLRYKNKIEYFDSYGEPPDSALSWHPLGILKELDQHIPYLTMLLKKSSLPVIINKKKFQEESPDVSTCGRHQIFRILQNERDNLELRNYIKLMEEIKKKTGLNYDEIVAQAIN